MSEMNQTPNEVPVTGESFNKTSQRYWRSLSQWGEDPEFQKLAETEFRSSPLREEKEEGWARREFLKLMGASLAMSAAGCIRRPVQKIVPYNKQPEEVTFGVDNFYTSTWSDGSDFFNILVRTREGRPLRVDGNPKSPFNGGGLSARAQAHILSVYDPDRFHEAKKNIQNMDKGKERSNRDTIHTKYDAADDAIVAELKKGGIALLTGEIASPTTRAVISDFMQAFPGQHYTYEPITYEDIRQGQRDCYGSEIVPSYRIEKAKLIVSIDADFLGSWLNSGTYQRQLANGRRNPKEMNKLVAFDSGYSVTGANADVRVRIKPSMQLQVAMGLAHEIIVVKKASRFASSDSVVRALSSYAGTPQKLGIDPALWSRLAEDLIHLKGQSLVLAGGLATATADSRALQIAVNLLNSALENDGATINYAAPHTGTKATTGSLEKLIQEMEKGSVKTLIMHATNPVYNSPLSARFVQALKKVNMVVSTADRNDETAKYADYVLPDPHPMEAWGDLEFVDGFLAIQQPTLRPLHDTRSFQLGLMTWAFLAERGPKRITQFETYYDYLRNYWKTEVHPKYGKGKSFEDFWEGALQEGFVGSVSEANKSSRTFKTEALSHVKESHSHAGYELVLYQSKAMADGSLANVSWLQELPDPVSKICWDNYVAVSLATAEKEHLKEGELVEVAVGDKKVNLHVHIQPGLHDESVAIAVGYGRTDIGKVGNHVGENAYVLADVKPEGTIYSGQAVSLTNLGGKYLFAVTQDHHSMEGRQIVAEASLEQYLKNPAANLHRHHVFSIWGGHAYNGNKWGMSVDLNTCTGCNACMIACQSENNVPVVGRKYVIEGREMHWMRIDRYYVGDPKDAQIVFQPVMCQQCDNAPCETVCPVLATNHSSEGLNDMVYNRCVGTRYCSNNCPYKVRRFNWFNYAKNIEQPLHLALNPDVTVRSRGVMEKCTFCVHRIKSARINAKREGRGLRDGEVKTACQQSCPSGAIVFGDLNDPNSEVSQIFKDQRCYSLLEEFGAKPSVRYMTKIRNNDDKRFSEGGHA